jgi:hypothetical protein
MTIYVHFKIAKAPVKLHNVESVSDAGVDSVHVRMRFSDNHQTFTDVRNVALTPEQAD